ncbi:MAG: DUF2344 domain-containing protein [Phycisphaerales bacterium]|nr:MAG: DUF2344 domain-containing protein [Phycisphaerales bacterium]
MIKFKVWGALRFLSHAEMLRVFQRACVRAGVNVQYSRGFNPRPKLSLPLPRPVGVESEDEVLSIRCSIPDARYSTRNTHDAILDTIKAGLSAQLPEGCELLSVRVAESAASIRPRSATYILPVKPEHLYDALGSTIDRLLASECLTVRRKTHAKKRRTTDDRRGTRIKNIDVRGFLASLEMTGEGIIVECKISPAGSIRIDEVLSLLQLDQSKLAGPIRRTSVQWQ